MSKPSNTGTTADRLRERLLARNGQAGAAAPSNGTGEKAQPGVGLPKVTTFTAADLMRMELPPPRFAVEGAVPEGLTVIAGKPKLGKSWLVLHIALAIALGGVALGRVSVQAAEVLYVSLEDTKRRLQYRISRLLGGGQGPPPALHLAHDWPRQDRGGLDALEDWLDDHPGVKLVIIDTWARWRPFRTARGDPYETDYADGTLLKGVADRRDVSVVVVHHCRKLSAADPLEEVSGSVGLTGACDGVLVLRRERGRHAATLMVTGRDLDEQELALAFDPGLCLWQVAAPAEECRVSDERRAVLKLFQPGQEMTCPQVQALTGKAATAVRQTLSRMARDGQLEATEKGKYRLPAKKESQQSHCHNPFDNDQT